jgi:hypothetical protein
VTAERWKVALPDGELLEPYLATEVCTAYDAGWESCGRHAVVTVEFGGGYEYESADLCLEHYRTAVRGMVACLERLELDK